MPRLILLIGVVLSAGALPAAQHSGSIRSGDQPVPGATVTATAGDRKLVTASDDAGRYAFEDLTPGIWALEVEMFGFQTAGQPLLVKDEPTTLMWVLQLKPRGAPMEVSKSEPAKAEAAKPGVTAPAPKAEEAKPAIPVSRTRNGESPRNGSEPGFVTLALNAESDAMAASAPEPPPPPANAEENGGGADAFVVMGSTSPGLEDARRQQGRDSMRGGYGYEAFAGGAFGTGPEGGPGFGPAGPPDVPGGPGGPGFGPAGPPDVPGGPGGPGGRGFSGGGPGRGGDRGGGRGFSDVGGGDGGRGGFGRRGTSGSRDRRTTSIGNRRQRSQVQGSAYMSLRNSTLDARPYSLSGQTAPKPSYAQSRFGFSIGGPLRIPKVADLEKTFFYVNYTGTRSRNPSNTLYTLASPLERAGDFSQAATAQGPVTIYDPLSRLPFAGNLVPRNRFNSASLGLLPYIPLPSYATAVQNYQFVSSVPNTNDNLGVRLTQTISRKDRVNFNVNFQRRFSQVQQAFQYRDESDGSGLSASAGYTHNFTTRFINNLNWSFSRNRSQMTPYFAYKTNVAQQLGIGGTSSDPRNWGPPNLSFTNFGPLADATPSLGRSQTSSVNDGVSIIHKSNTLTFGGNIRRIQGNSFAENGRGGFTFSGISTSAFDANGSPLRNTGYDFADFLLGLPQSSSIRYGAANNYFRAQAYGAYVNDDWRVRPRFTVNAGLRYEYFTPYTEKYGHLANLDIAPGFTGVAVVTPGQTGPYSGQFPDALVNPDGKEFSPRIGVAWRPAGKKSIVVRSGYGIFFQGSVYDQFPGRLASQPPFATTASTTTSTARTLTLQDGFANAPNQNVTNTYAVDRYYHVPYVQTWNFTVQQTLKHGVVLSTGYMGTKGTRLDLQTQPNRAAPGSPLTAEQRRQIGNATGFTYDTSVGNSIYHALDVGITRRFQKGFSANLNYVFSKSIDNASSFGGGIVQDPGNLRAERGLSSFDVRHNLSSGFYVVSPIGERGLMKTNRWARRFLGDWALTSNITFSSGTPLTARVLGNLSNLGGNIGSGRADATGLSVTGGPGFFNPLAFAIPPSLRFGNAGRDTIPGPNRFGMNAGLSRSIRLGADGRRRVELRLEAANVLNHVGITSFGTVLNSATYGLPTAANGMRTVNALMRFRF